MMRFVMVIVEEEILHDFVDAQVPSAFAHIEFRPGMIGVLQRTPIDGEGRVAEQPALPRGVGHPYQEDLHEQREKNFQSNAGGRRVIKTLEHSVSRCLLSEHGIFGAEKFDAECARPHQVHQHSQRRSNPVKTRQDGIPLGVFQQTIVRGAEIIELLHFRAVIAVVTQMEDALKHKCRGKKSSREPPAPFVHGAVLVKNAVHGFVQEGKNRIVDE
jgi:hypothetical protein